MLVNIYLYAFLPHSLLWLIIIMIEPGLKNQELLQQLTKAKERAAAARALVNETLRNKKWLLQSLKDECDRNAKLVADLGQSEREKTNLRRTLIESIDGITLESFMGDGKVYAHINEAFGDDKRYAIQVGIQ